MLSMTGTINFLRKNIDNKITIHYNKLAIHVRASKKFTER